MYKEVDVKAWNITMSSRQLVFSQKKITEERLQKI